jgi:hypothetical protein
MHPRLLFSEEDEVRKKKTLVLVVAFLLILSLLGLYAAIGPEGELFAGMTPTALPSPSAVVTATLPVPTFTARATPTASATLVAKATATSLVPSAPVSPEPTVIPTSAAATAPGPSPTRTATPLPPTYTTAATTPLSTLTSVPPQPTATPTAVPVAIEPTTAPTVFPTAPLAAPVITTPPDGSVLKDDRPPIAGTAPPNTTVQVYDDGDLVGAATADAQGDWALVPDESLEPGEHTVTAVASDEAGGTSDPSAAVTFTVATERLPVAGGSWFERCLDRLLSIALP